MLSSNVTKQNKKKNLRPHVNPWRSPNTTLKATDIVSNIGQALAWTDKSRWSVWISFNGLTPGAGMELSSG